MPTHDRPARLHRIIEVGTVFLRLGAVGFGGPAAIIAMMREEVVSRRRWVNDQHFLDLLGATNLIPGPNASEMTMFLGYARAGIPGLIVAGTAFVLPAMLIVLGLAWAYVTYGTTPAVGWLLYGIKPVIIPLIVLALWSLGRRAVTGPATGLVGVAALVLTFLNVVHFVLLMLSGGVVILLVRSSRTLIQSHRAGALVPLPLALLGTGLPAASSASLGSLFWIFARIGALMYGSGYVLLAFLQADFVDRRGWLTQQELIDAVAIGQITPGPLSTSATFIGYLLGGVPGALVGTLGIYLPGFVIAAVSHPVIPRLRDSQVASGFLDGVNVAALGVMAAVTVELARAAYVDGYTVLTGLAAAGLLLRWRISPVSLVACGAVAGLLRAAG
jgi:chromate transporter